MATPDYVVFNLENGGFAATGQNVVGVSNFATDTASVFFFADADLDSSNVILTAPLSALGLSPSSKFDFSVYAFDNYFTGNLTDAIEGLTYTPAIAALRRIRRTLIGSTGRVGAALDDSVGPWRRCRVAITDRNPADVPRWQGQTGGRRDQGRAVGARFTVMGRTLADVDHGLRDAAIVRNSARLFWVWLCLWLLSDSALGADPKVGDPDVPLAGG